MGVPVYKRILDLFEAEGVNTLFGIPDPNFVHMFSEADARGCVRSVALMAALTQGRNFLLRGVPREVEQQREDALGEENESDFFLLMRAFSSPVERRMTRPSESTTTCA